MNKLRADLRLAVLGGVAGLLSISVFLLIARIETYYAYLEDRPDYHRVEDLWWMPVVFWHVVLSAVASIIAHRYSTQSCPRFLLWQGIGLITLIGWLLTFLAAGALNGLMHGIERVETLVSLADFGAAAKYVAVVFACHVLYGTAMQSSSREYLPDIPEKSEEVNVVKFSRRSFRKLPKESLGTEPIKQTSTPVHRSRRLLEL